MSDKRFRVLLVDDSAPFRRQVGGALEASGLCVVEATEGVEAMWRARSEGVFDVILMDIHMPNVDGLTIIRELRKLPGYTHVPIVVLTSDGSKERRLEGRSAGATAWLLKPPDMPGLINAVHASLMRSTRPNEAAESLRPRAPAGAAEVEAGVRPEWMARSQRSAPRSDAAGGREPRARSEAPRAPRPGEARLQGSAAAAGHEAKPGRRSDPARIEPLRSERSLSRSERPASQLLRSGRPERSENVEALRSERGQNRAEPSAPLRAGLALSAAVRSERPRASGSEQPLPRRAGAASGSEQPRSRGDASLAASKPPRSGPEQPPDAERSKTRP